MFNDCNIIDCAKCFGHYYTDRMVDIRVWY